MRQDISPLEEELLQEEIEVAKRRANVDRLRAVVTEIRSRIASLEAGGDAVDEPLPGVAADDFSDMKPVRAILKHLKRLKEQGKEPRVHMRDMLTLLIAGGNQTAKGWPNPYHNLSLSLSTSPEVKHGELVYDDISTDEKWVGLPDSK